ncbi:MAG: 50S ribosomal protein L24 [Candidatus Nanohaloarchaea archaeon]
MTQDTDNWSRHWNSSTKPSKQRKYRDNAPQHVKDKLLSANVSPELREELGTRSISLRTGDRVEVMRGDDSGVSGIVSNIDRDSEKVYVDGIEHEKVDGTMREKALRPSNLQVQALNIEDERRLEKYEISDVEEIGVEEEEMEEALEEEEEGEMMQQMQGGEASEEIETEEVEEEETEAEEEDSEDGTAEAATADYDDIVSGTISDAKDQLQELESPDYSAALEAEKKNKNRTTFIDWLESQAEEE